MEDDKEEQVIECIDLTTDTDCDSENSDVTVEEAIERQIEKIKKVDEPKYKIKSVVLLHLQSQA